jgi:Zn-dependent metalloprotease
MKKMFKQIIRLIIILECARAGFCQAEAKLQEATVRALAAPPSSPALDGVRVAKRSVDSLGNIHVALDGIRQGHRVIGGKTIQHTFKNGSSKTTLPSALANAVFDDTPVRVTEAQALDAALLSLAMTHIPPTKVITELIYVKISGVFRLVYSLELAFDPKATHKVQQRAWVDPQSGIVLRSGDVTQHLATGEGYGRQYKESVPLQTLYVPQNEDHPGQPGYLLVDTTRSNTQLRTASYLDQTCLIENASKDFFSPDDIFGNGKNLLVKDPYCGIKDNSPLGIAGQTSAADAHYSLEMAWDLYTHVFGRNGPLGTGEALTANVHYTGGSFYNPLERSLFLRGAGTISNKICDAETDFLVVGHEVGHAFFRQEIYESWGDGESGGINEATGDIMGKLTQIYAASARGEVVPELFKWLPKHWPNWDMYGCGGQTLKRSMRRPSLVPEHLDAWSEDINVNSIEAHFASGPISRMFYFLSEGVIKKPPPIGPPPKGEQSIYLPKGLVGVGVNTAADLYARAIAHYLRDEPTFSDLRDAMIQAAQASEDTTAEKAVADAFAAINVGASADREAPKFSNVPMVSAPGLWLNVDVDDPSGIKKVTIGTPGVIWDTLAVEPWRATVPINTPGGLLTLELCATDKLDNTACKPSLVYIDATPPTVTSFDKTSQYVQTNGVVRLTANDDSGITHVRARIPGFNAPLSLIDANFGPIKDMTFARDFTVPSSVKDGVYDLTIFVSDFAHTTTVTPKLFIDRTAPDKCEIKTLEAYEDSNGGWSSSVHDAMSGLISVVFSVDGKEYESYLFSSPRLDYFTGGGLFKNNFSAGTHTLSLVCTDVVGNKATDSQQFIIDPPPTGSITILSQSTGAAKYKLHVADPDGIATLGGKDIECAQSGLHHTDWTLVGNPITFDQIYEVSGLILGERCLISSHASDIHGIQAGDIFLYFDVTGPPPPPPPTDTQCNSMVHSGGLLAETHIINVGKAKGTVRFTRETYQVPDIFTLSCADGGTIAGHLGAESTGCVVTNGRVFNDVAIACNTGRVKVQVTPDCIQFGSTAWDFSLGCTK